MAKVTKVTKVKKNVTKRKVTSVKKTPKRKRALVDAILTITEDSTGVMTLNFGTKSGCSPGVENLVRTTIKAVAKAAEGTDRVAVIIDGATVFAKRTNLY